MKKVEKVSDLDLPVDFVSNWLRLSEKRLTPPWKKDVTDLKDRSQMLQKVGENRTRLLDHIEGGSADEMRQLISYQHKLLRNDLAAFLRYPREKKKILISGATGFVGSHLQCFLRSLGHEVLSLVRKKEGEGIYWDGEHTIDQSALEGLDAVIHLSGENVGALRWTDKKKERILRSRVKSTQFLVRSLNALTSPPKTLISASAIGFFGDRGEEVLKESSSEGVGFLPSVTKQWEEAAMGYKKGRVVCARFGAILSPNGGMLKKLLPSFSRGIGGILGSGEQWMSWIALDDLLYSIYHILQKEEIEGVAIVASPYPVTNLEFTKTLGKVLHRPTIFPLPSFIVKTIFGQMGRELLLASTKALPQTLIDTNMQFAFPSLEKALLYMLGRENGEESS